MTAVGSSPKTTAVATSWSPIVVTLVFSLCQGFVFFAFFLIQRWFHKRRDRYDVYESRQFSRSHRSPPPYGWRRSVKEYEGDEEGQTVGFDNKRKDDEDRIEETASEGRDFGMGPLGWALAALSVSDAELLRCVGLDSYMFLRFLRLGLRVTLVGSFLGVVILIPIYKTGEAEGAETEEFNSITVAKVVPGSNRLYATVSCWYIFVSYLLWELWAEWSEYATRRYDFLARGDVDTPGDYRYAVMVENVPRTMRYDGRLRVYFDRLFPGKVRQASVCLDTRRLDGLVAERKKKMEWYEAAEAKARLSGKKPIIRVGESRCCSMLGGGDERVDAMAYYRTEIDRLNEDVDEERDALHAFADGMNRSVGSHDAEGTVIGSMISDLWEVNKPGNTYFSPLFGGLGGSGKKGIADVERDDLIVRKNEEGAVDDARPDRGKLTRNVIHFKYAGKNAAQKLVAEQDKCDTAKIGCSASHDAKMDNEKQAGKVFEARKNAVSSSVTASTGGVDTGVEITGGNASSETGIVKNGAALNNARAAPTAFVTFTSLRAKQCAVQCEINGRDECMDVLAAPEPGGVIWENVAVPGSASRIAQWEAAALWTVGVLFWTVPVTFVTSVANLDSILNAMHITGVDTGSFIYGLVSGLLPVVALSLLMMLVPMAIGVVAVKFIRMKSRPEAENYTFFWHQLYHYANLWLIIIGGSLFNQINGLINEPTSVIRLIASAMTGSSTFFADMIIWATFASFGMELSMFTAYGTKLIMGIIRPESRLTQRMLDDAETAPSLRWGTQLPPMVFIFLVSLVYMPVVPIIEVFAVAFFGGAYVVWKHQCLHVYAQEFEGGGVIWQELFRFLMGSLYMAEAVFIAMMGIKDGSVQFAMGFVPLVCTIILHKILRRKIICPLRNLALEVAATIDIEEGELVASDDDWGPHVVSVERQLYGQPVLKASLDERCPMPYRRNNGTAMLGDADNALRREDDESVDNFERDSEKVAQAP